MLSGCFASARPLISSASADTPFAGGAIFTEYANCETAKLLQCSGYSLKGTGSLSLKHGSYVFNPDPGDDTAAVMAAQAGPGSDMSFLLKREGDDLFIGQLKMGGVGDNERDQYIYELVQIKGSTAYIYILMCEEMGDKRYVRSGLLSGINTTIMPMCETDDLSKLATIFRDRLADGAVPNEKLEFKS